MARGEPNMVKLLLDFGAEWTIQNVNGQTALDVGRNEFVQNLIIQKQIKRLQKSLSVVEKRQTMVRS